MAGSIRETPWTRAAVAVTLLGGLALAGGLGAAVTTEGIDVKQPQEKTVGKIEQVAAFDGPMPTGVTVSHEGRIFVNYPRWGDPVEFTVAELRDGKPVAFPEDLNR